VVECGDRARDARLAAVEIVPFGAEHLDGVLVLCVAEGWPSLPEDPARALRLLTAPGVTTVLAVEQDEVVGFAELMSDGALQGFLTSIAVDARFRRRGIGRALVEASLRLAGATRVDLLSEDASVGFYEAFPHSRKPGFRLYPFHQAGDD
jgi:ribosomal protein S18 acetylase RimI-like enzyme